MAQSTAEPSVGSGGGNDDYSSYRAVDLDFHQCLSDAERSPKMGNPRPGMLEGVQAVLDQDPRNIIIISCGGLTTYGDDLKAAFRMWLRKQGITDLDLGRFTFETKPKTIAVIDDHGLPYNGKNAVEVWSEVLRRLKRLDTQGPDVLPPYGPGSAGR